jgi:Spy/CpxP family protein refolding chaperone
MNLIGYGARGGLFPGLACELPLWNAKNINTKRSHRRTWKMKKLSILLAMVVLLGATTLALAGPKGTGGGMRAGMDCGLGPGMGAGMGPGMGAGMGPGMGGYCRLDQLNLTAEQKTKVQALRDAHWNEVNPIRTELFQKHDELRQLWSKTSPDADAITAKQQEISELQNQLRSKVTQFQLELRKLLTPEQQEKLISSAPGMGRGPHGRGRGMGNW